MAQLTYPTTDQVAVVEQRAELLRRAYAAFTPPPASQLPKPGMLAMFKSLFSMPLGATGTEFDWRDKLPLPKAQFQGRCYCCTSYATAAAIEISALIASPGNPIKVSAEYLHTCVGNSGNQDPDSICGSPVDAERLLEALSQQGYALGDDAQPFPPTACAATPTLAPITGFSVVADTATAKKQILARPLIANMCVGDDFMSYTTAKSPVYTPDGGVPAPYPHCVCVVGFSAAGWIIRNSFGTEWGDGTGYATVAYGACGLFGAPLPGGASGCPAYALRL